MPILEYECFINDYEIGTIEFRLANRLKATETAIKILATGKNVAKTTIETLYRQGITLVTILTFFNKTYNLSEWIGKFSKYLQNETTTIDSSIVLNDDQTKQLVLWYNQWGANSFLITDNTDMTPFVSSGMVEVTTDARYHLYFYTLTDKALKLVK